MKPTDIKTLREARGWDQQTLAQRAGVDQSLISRIESGETLNPTSKTLLALAKALRVNPNRIALGPEAA